jgi:hypothetical protein
MTWSLQQICRWRLIAVGVIVRPGAYQPRRKLRISPPPAFPTAMDETGPSVPTSQLAIAANAAPTCQFVK